ncbi:hypothetical protein KGP36_07640 [Patescibacteria group bacterium]|nr:hypothetical protein [Patescibacteria group bacterium]
MSEEKGEVHFDQSSVVFLAKGDMARWLYNWQPDFCKKAITTWMPDHSAVSMLIFEYTIGSALRNPRKLLKSVRNKLMQAVRQQQLAFEDEMHEATGGNLPTDHCV